MNDKLTIQQIHASEPETLWHFLTQLPASLEAQLLVGLLLAGFLGAIASWLIKWSNDDAAGLVEYCFRNSFKRTVASVLSFLGIVFGFIALEIFTTDSGEFVGWMNVMVNGFMAGIGSDATINKGKRVTWTEAQRSPPPPTDSPTKGPS